MRFTLFVTAVFTAATLAGCAGSAPAPTDSANGEIVGPPVDVGDGVIISANHGAVRGTVHTDTGLVMPNANVGLVGTDHSMVTNKTGEFLFLNVSVGKYTLRIEASKYRAYESQVEVKASAVVEIHPTLVPLEAGNPNYQTHLHDYWGADTQVVLVDKSYKMNEFRVASTTAEAYPAANEVSASVLYANTVFGGLRYRIPLPENPDRPPLVYGGTEKIEVKFSWNSAPPAVPTYAFAYTTAVSSNLTYMDAQGPGVPWTVLVDPATTDNGHQAFSLWNFYVVPVNNAASAPNYRPALSIDPIQVKITVFKGGSPAPEPAHPEFWANGSRIAIRDGASDPLTVSANVWGVNSFPMPREKIIPPGTKWLELELRWSYTDAVPANAALNPNYVIYYNPGNEHPDRFMKDWKVAKAKASPSSGTIQFNITLEPGEADAFYQKITLWRFRVRHDESPWGQDGLQKDFYRTRTFQLLVTAVQDPEIAVR